MNATPEQIERIFQLQEQGVLQSRRLMKASKLTYEVVQDAQRFIRQELAERDRQVVQATHRAERYDRLLSQAHPWREVERGRTNVRPHQDDRGPTPNGMRLHAVLSLMTEAPAEFHSRWIPLAERET